MPQDYNHEKKDRRSGIDRRQFSYAVHIPERRKNGDRRQLRRTPHKRLQEDLILMEAAPGWKQPIRI
jgi:hypothetical protein